MAWYRVGGGGLPPQIKTDMNNVLNKKMGTSGQTYPPSEWADDVNLLGLLAEQSTVLAAVTIITNGADRVPIKAWEIDIPASLDGVSSVVCTQAGKNLLPNKTYQRNVTTLRIGTDTLDGTLTFQAGTYTLSVKTALTGATLNYTSGGSTTSISTSTDGDYRKGTFTLSGKTELFFGCYNSGGITSAQVSELQLEVGNSRTTYTPYTAPTVTTVSLGRTIYGGSVDVVNGTGTDNCTRVKFSDLNWTYYTGGTNPIFYAQNVPNMKTYARGELPNIAIDGYTTRFAQSRSYLSTNMANMECSAIEEFQTIAFRNTSYTSKDAMLAALGNEYIVYEVSDSTSCTFSPMSTIPETVLGTITLFADIGKGSVIYRTNGIVTPIVPTLISKSITENGTYSAEDDDADGYDEVTVNVSPNVGTKNITENGTYTASADSLDGYSSVTVNVPTAPSGMVVMDFSNISSPFTLNGVSYGSTGAVFDSTSDYIDLPFFHAGMEIEIDVASISLGQNANRRFFSSYRNQGFLYRNSNVWSFYNGSWYDTNIADSTYFDNSTVKIVVDSNNFWHIYKDDVLIFEPAGACAISEPAIGSKDGSCINNATITGVRMKEVT